MLQVVPNMADFSEIFMMAYLELSPEIQRWLDVISEFGCRVSIKSFQEFVDISSNNGNGSPLFQAGDCVLLSCRNLQNSEVNCAERIRILKRQGVFTLVFVDSMEKGDELLRHTIRPNWFLPLGFSEQLRNSYLSRVLESIHYSRIPQNLSGALGTV